MSGQLDRIALGDAADLPALGRVVQMLKAADANVVVVRERLGEGALFVCGTAPGTVAETAVELGLHADAVVDDAADTDVPVIRAHRAREVRSVTTGSLPHRLAARSRGPTVDVPND